ncbi:MAG TPA: polysaccharide deacetylase family protein [Chitinophagaceae bacterium]|jgi:sialate O-acetylesterase|nr:polysaccharide deacetylase family protein [Chitinophagaceae bacterium]
MKKRWLFLLLCFCAGHLPAQDWQGKKCAVVLTYDDALNVHLDNVVPALDSLGLRGSFYLTVSFPGFTARMNDWKKAAARHELANHTLFHPCNGRAPGRSFVRKDYDLATYSVPRMQDELRLTNTVLQALDGRTERTFAYPCGDTEAGGVSYVDTLKSSFAGARGVVPALVPFRRTDLYRIGSVAVNGQSGPELIEWVKRARAANSLVVFLFHGVGGEHSLNVSLEAHRMLLRYLKENEDEVWNPTFLEAVKWLGRAQ